jgi:hypothetical protein
MGHGKVLMLRITFWLLACPVALDMALLSHVLRCSGKFIGLRPMTDKYVVDMLSHRFMRTTMVKRKPNAMQEEEPTWQLI